MAELLTALGIDPATLVKATFEPNLLLIFFLCLFHSLRTHGWRRTAREFSAGFLLTALCESAGVLSGAYVYPGFQLYVLATPVGNPASWVALVYIIMTVTDRIVLGWPAPGTRGLGEERKPLLRDNLLLTIVALAVVDATFALCLDLVLDPLATIYNWWLWVPYQADVTTISAGVVDTYNFDHMVWLTTPDNPLATWFAGFFPGGFRYPTRVLGIPLINFIAWFVFVFIFSSQFRFVESRERWSQWKRTWVLWLVVLVDVPILCVLLIAPNI